MLTTRRCACLQRFATAKRCQLWRVLRYQSTVPSPTSTIPPALLGRAQALAAEHAELSKQLNSEYDTRIAKKAGSLSAVVTALNGWELTSNSLPELQQLIKDPSTDPELRSLAEEELQSTTEKLSSLSSDLQKSLIPEHPFAQMQCLIEIRPGAGGDEAGIFAGNLLQMYQGYCRRQGLRVNILKFDATKTQGLENSIQEAVLEIETPGAYDMLRCEAGVHRVQRVPATEVKGRTHTSAVSVLVLPNFPSQGEDELGESNFEDPSNDYYVDPTDVRTDVMRAKGAGGQHVNTTDSAVRLTHLPTNTVVAIQDSRSQQQNRAKAWQILRAKLAQARRDAREEEMAQLRLSIVGVSKMGRGDKVRTYNWGQQRVTDHRSGITLHHLDDILEGGESLDKVMASVREWLKMQDLQLLVADEEAARAKADI
ncbi:hypothetical protein HO133_005768 [Letharia lupina]|uniref:Prokaryotic-type class I peptide chain release factors domain-containing protein n=1 Tax=Letharia lupina TaxID=560253 RepID=A0A8H6F8D5_9LECA|nr:uncharacterized protein HO133_005768 [Letharia lupina]KAF6218419.1 hypothetical protein HO133_005768 [Letharia lupina]